MGVGKEGRTKIGPAGFMNRLSSTRYSSYYFKEN